MNNKSFSASLVNNASRIVAAYIKSHHVSYDELPVIMNTVCATLSKDQGRQTATYSMSSIKPALGVTPAVAIEDSVHDDYLICLEDGKRLQMLKRHLKTLYSMSLDQYRERWNLPGSYPMVAPSYARRRSEIAKNIGLGRGNKKSSMKMIRGETTAEGQEQVGIVKI